MSCLSRYAQVHVETQKAIHTKKTKKNNNIQAQKTGALPLTNTILKSHNLTHKQIHMHTLMHRETQVSRGAS